MCRIPHLTQHMYKQVASCPHILYISWLHHISFFTRRGNFYIKLYFINCETRTQKQTHRAASGSQKWHMFGHFSLWQQERYLYPRKSKYNDFLLAFTNKLLCFLVIKFYMFFFNFYYMKLNKITYLVFLQIELLYFCNHYSPRMGC